MARRRWVQQDDGTLVELGLDDELPSRHAHHGRVHGDLHYDGLCTTEGVDISTRTKHREYMKRTGLTTADDFKGEWSKAREQRERFYTEGNMTWRDKRERREAVERALYQPQRRK